MKTVSTAPLALRGSVSTVSVGKASAALARLSRAFRSGPRFRFIEHRELDFLLHWINAIDKHPDSLPDAVDLARVLADDFARALMVGVTIVGQRIERDQALNEQIAQLDEETELGHAGNEAVEVLAHAVLHELYFLPRHQFALGVISASLGLTGLFGDVVEFLDRDGPAQGFERFAVRGMVTTLRPGRGRFGISICRAGVSRPRDLAAVSRKHAHR